MLSEKLAKSLTHQVPRTADQLNRITVLRESAARFGEALEACTKTSREQSLAITRLEEALMWSIKGVVLETATLPIEEKKS